MTVTCQQIKVKTLDHFDPGLPLPNYETEGAAGADVRAQLRSPEYPQKLLVIKPGMRVLIPTGLTVEIPVGYELQVRPRSGLSYKTGLMILNSPGTIDADYRGEIKIIMGNLGNRDEVINHGDRVAQLVLAPITRAEYFKVDGLSETQRSSGGFGSTGRN